MPRAEVNVDGFNLVSDLNNYYSGCVVSYRGQPAWVRDIMGSSNAPQANIKVLPQSGGWGPVFTVDFDQLDLHMPRLGFVKSGTTWFYLSRNPQRRMRKGYSQELVRGVSVGVSREDSGTLDVMHSSTVRQIWYGNTDRINEDTVVFNRSVYFEQDKVADVDEEGNLIILAGKEKLGEFVCKLLANNWDNLSSRFSIRRLP